MSILKIKDCGYAERETELNWAAEYARRLVTNEVKARIEAVDAEAAARAAADETEAAARKAADTAETAERKAADAAMLKDAKSYADNAKSDAIRIAGDNIDSRIGSFGFSSLEHMAQQVSGNKSGIGSLNGHVESLERDLAEVRKTAESALTEIPPSAVGVLGGIKPLLDGTGKINRSGLVIGEDGTTYVNTKTERGITRDGAGQIGINPATPEEVAAEKEEYKPVTPNTLGAAFYRRGSYSKTPKQIGAWIDATPVYRVAIRITLTKDDFTTGYYKLKTTDLGIKGTGDALVLSSYLRAAWTVNGMEDSAPVEIGDSLYINLDGIDTRYTTLYGYVDFISEADNILTQEG